jgi:hypothetical protein
LAVLTIVFPNPIMLLVVLLGGLETWRRWHERKSPEGQTYYAIPALARLVVAATYLGLVGLLTFGMAETHIERDFGDV